MAAPHYRIISFYAIFKCKYKPYRPYASYLQQYLLIYRVLAGKTRSGNLIQFPTIQPSKAGNYGIKKTIRFENLIHVLVLQFVKEIRLPRLKTKLCDRQPAKKGREYMENINWLDIPLLYSSCIPKHLRHFGAETSPRDAVVPSLRVNIISIC